MIVCLGGELRYKCLDLGIGDISYEPNKADWSSCESPARPHCNTKIECIVRWKKPCFHLQAGSREFGTVRQSSGVSLDFRAEG